MLKGKPEPVVACAKLLNVNLFWERQRWSWLAKQYSQQSEWAANFRNPVRRYFREKMWFVYDVLYDYRMPGPVWCF